MGNKKIKIEFAKVKKINSFKPLRLICRNRSNFKFFFTILFYIKKHDNLFYLYKLKKIIQECEYNNYLLDGQFTVAEYLTFTFVNRAANIFLLNQNNFYNVNYFIHQSSVSLKFFNRKEFFDGNIFILEKNEHSPYFLKFRSSIDTEKIMTVTYREQLSKFDVVDAKNIFKLISAKPKSQFSFKVNKQYSYFTVIIYFVIAKPLQYFIAHLKRIL